MTDCKLPVNQIFFLPEMNELNLEIIFGILRDKREIHLIMDEGAQVPALVTLLGNLFRKLEGGKHVT